MMKGVETRYAAADALLLAQYAAASMVARPGSFKLKDFPGFGHTNVGPPADESATGRRMTAPVETLVRILATKGAFFGSLKKTL